MFKNKCLALAIAMLCAVPASAVPGIIPIRPRPNIANLQPGVVATLGAGGLVGGPRIDSSETQTPGGLVGGPRPQVQPTQK